MIKAESHAQGVRITVDVPAGQEWTVTRTDGFPVRGGAGVGPATFLDVAAPVNEPVTYLIDPPAWVEVGRNLATNPNWERLTMDAWKGHEDSIYSSAVVNADWTGSGKAGRSTWDVKVNDGGNSGYSIIRESQLEVGRTYTFVQRIKFGQAGWITPYVPWAYVVPEQFDVEPGEIVTKYITFVYSAEIPANSRMSLNLSSTGENVWIEYGDPLIYEGEYQPDRPWFSGDHAPDGMRSEWLGEPNNSVSVLYEFK